MPDFFSIFMNDSMDTANMKGMLQMVDLMPKCMDTANSVGLMEFGNGPSQQSICTAHITQAAMAQVVQDTSQLMGPLLVKALINFAKARAAAKQRKWSPPTSGTASACVLARTALTGALYRRAVHLTAAAHLRLPNSAVLNHVSTDVSRVDACAQWFHAAWTAPIQTTGRLIMLPVELGPSALAGFALFLLIIPLQERVMAHQFALRQGSLKWTDETAGRVLEVVASMRVVKYFCYEGSFLARLFRIRMQELRGIRKIQHLQSANIALAFSLPVLAATLAFVTYTETSKQFDVAVCFVDIGEIGLTDLGSNIAITPQEGCL
ncbi:hypothetical protein B0H13DRAFT_2359637 [Mycena leptocephala]|nr:hypothetical protein B0H13DRAFT_2359637 [Mycena leptocephala]